MTFAGCCAALTVLFLLRSSWLTEGFSAVLSALCLFAPFEEFVNSNFHPTGVLSHRDGAVPVLYRAGTGKTPLELRGGHNNEKQKEPAGQRQGIPQRVYSTAILAAAILLAVLVNLVVRALPSKYTEFDLSEGKMYTLGDSSVQLAQSLQQDVTIYYLCETGSEDAIITEAVGPLRRRKQPYPLGAEGPSLTPPLRSTGPKMHPPEA